MSDCTICDILANLPDVSIAGPFSGLKEVGNDFNMPFGRDAITVGNINLPFGQDAVDVSVTKDESTHVSDILDITAGNGVTQ